MVTGISRSPSYTFDTRVPIAPWRFFPERERLITCRLLLLGRDDPAPFDDEKKKTFVRDAAGQHSRKETSTIPTPDQ